ncbi:MAG: potassium transporter TrkA [Armatimonadetes bacterium]|nr:potassium transporter TrkA [Armatimonadota bacterium]
MTGILVVFITVSLSLIAVRIGAVALQMTGLDEHAALFQALSAFTGTGFTTREAELIVRHPVRRRITMALMMGGNAGVVTGIAGMVSTLGFAEPPLMTFLKLTAVALALYLLSRLLSVETIERWLRREIRSGLQRYAHIEPIDFEEVLEQQEGWGIFRVRVGENAPCAGKSLAETKLRSQGITVVAIERGGHLIPSPGGDHVILTGDYLIVYGRLDRIERMLGVEAAAREGTAESMAAENSSASV